MTGKTNRIYIGIAILAFLAASVFSISNSWAIDGVAAPTLLSPDNNSITNDNTPTFDWTDASLPVPPVKYFLVVATDSDFISPVIKEEGLSFSTFTPTTELPDGVYFWIVIASDSASPTINESFSTTFSFTVDTVAPAAPLINSPADGSTTNDSTPTISGTAEANASVQVFVDGNSVGTVAAGIDGSWSYTLTEAQALSDGSHTATALATDAAGNPSQPSTPVTFTIDRTLSVSIDIKPGSFPNSINPNGKGVIPVAILTTHAFDAATVDALSIKFGPGMATESHGKGHLEDVDGDDDMDMVLHFNTQQTGIACGQTSATLTGLTLDGMPIEGSDSIRTVPCK